MTNTIVVETPISSVFDNITITVVKDIVIVAGDLEFYSPPNQIQRSVINGSLHASAYYRERMKGVIFFIWRGFYSHVT